MHFLMFVISKYTILVKTWTLGLYDKKYAVLLLSQPLNNVSVLSTPAPLLFDILDLMLVTCMWITCDMHADNM